MQINLLLRPTYSYLCPKTHPLMKRIGILSDTHGTFDAPLQEFLRDVDEIWHAGDIGSPELADHIARFKPLRAVYGNIDGGAVRLAWPEFASFRCEEVPVLMTHIGGYPRRYDPRALQKIETLRPKLFVAGHSHILKVVYDPVHDLLHINPGAAGCYGFHKVRTAVRLTIDGADMRDMEVGEWHRPDTRRGPCREPPDDSRTGLLSVFVRFGPSSNLPAPSVLRTFRNTFPPPKSTFFCPPQSAGNHPKVPNRHFTPIN